MVNPRIAIVLRHYLLCPDLRGLRKLGLLKSLLTHVDPALSTSFNANGEDSLDLDFYIPEECNRYVSSSQEAECFMFKIIKLSRPQTLELNSTVSLKVEETCSLTFLSRECILRTAGAFRSSPSHLRKSNLLVPFIKLLAASTIGSSTIRPPLQSSAPVPDEDIDAFSFVDVVLYGLHMKICTRHRQLPSAYDMAHLFYRFMEKARPNAFSHEISREVEKVFQAFKGELEDLGSFREGVSVSPFLFSIPTESSCRLFRLMTPYMSKLDTVTSGGDGILEEPQDEVTIMSFLTRASCSPPM